MTLGSAPFIDPSAAWAAPKPPRPSKVDKKPPKAPAKQAPDPNRKATGYRVRMAGITLPGVSVSALTDEVQVVETRSGNDGRTRISAGRAVVGEVTLNGTGPIPRILVDLWHALEDGNPHTEDIAVETLDDAGVPIYQHRLFRALPKKLTTTPGKDKWTMTFAVETMELYRTP